MKSILTGFKDFISRGNVIDLAVAVVIGAAFGRVVTALVDGFISPLVGFILGSSSLASAWHINLPGDAELNIGLILDSILQFLFVAATIYFLIVLPLNKLAERRKKGIEPESKAPAEDVRLLEEIRDLLAAQAGVSRSPKDSDPTL